MLGVCRQTGLKIKKLILGKVPQESTHYVGVHLNTDM